jgi:hypothetical protein
LVLTIVFNLLASINFFLAEIYTRRINILLNEDVLIFADYSPMETQYGNEEKRLNAFFEGEAIRSK